MFYIIENEDYVAVEDDCVTVVFHPGEVEKTFSVKLVDDPYYEGPESFNIMILDISLPFGVQLGAPQSSVVTILDDESKCNITLLQGLLASILMVTYVILNTRIV